MLRRTAILTLAAAALLAPVGVAAAEPSVPQPDTTCTPNLAAAMTWPTDAKAPLVCDGARWEPVADPYPISDTWVSFGPVITLHGQGRRNPTLLSGDWTATPLTPESLCSATQLAVVPDRPATGPPMLDHGDPGQPLSLRVVPTLATIELSGDCLWRRVLP